MDTVGLRTNSFPDKCTPFSGDNFLIGLVRAAEKKVRDDLRVLEPGGGAHGAREVRAHRATRRESVADEVAIKQRC